MSSRSLVYTRTTVDGVDPGTSVGPLLVGVLLNTWMYGMMLMQVHKYFCSIGPRDPKWIRYLVLWLLALDTANTVIDCVFCWDFTINKFGNYEALATMTWEVSSDPVMTVFISSTVQSFFGWRLYKLTRRNWLAMFIWCSAATQFLTGLATSIGFGIVKDFDKVQKLRIPATIWLVLAPVTDFLISVPLVWHLHRHKTGVAATDDIVERISRLALQTCAVTAVCAVVDLTLYLAVENNIHFLFNIALAKLYSNCLMASLNARANWADASWKVGDEPSAGAKDFHGAAIHITTTTDVQYHDPLGLDTTRGTVDHDTYKLPTHLKFSALGQAFPMRPLSVHHPDVKKGTLTPVDGGSKDDLSTRSDVIHITRAGATTPT